MRSPYYVLDDNGDPVQALTAMTWALWFENSVGDDRRRVACDELPDGRYVSTVFLGIDHNHSRSGPPILFETMVFDKEGNDNGEQWRYSTRAEALAGHADVLASLKAEL